MKKRNILIPALSLLALLSSCSFASINDGIMKITGTKDETIQKLATQTVLGLSSLDLSNFGTRKMANRNFNESEVEDIKDVLAQVEVFLSKDNNLKIEELKSEKAEYSNRIDLDFFDQDISLYFNDVSKGGRVDEGEVEEYTSFKGIALYKDQEFQFTFVHEEEKEIGEEESETTLILYEDSNNYIEISQENEEEALENQVSYSYKEIADSKKVIDFELSIEKELSEKKVEVEIDNVEYSFKYVTLDKKDYIKVEIENNDNEVRGLFERKEVVNEDGSISVVYDEVK